MTHDQTLRDPERDAFEKYFVDRHDLAIPMEAWEDGPDYDSLSMNEAWHAWQARAAISHKESA